MIAAYPLQWPAGWPRTPAAARTSARFGVKRAHRPDSAWMVRKPLTIAEANARLREQLRMLGVHDDDLVISSNLRLRVDGQPRSDQRDPDDPGVCVYWVRSGQYRSMALDRYDRAADNIAGLAATLEAMRAIERHGGHFIFDRAFTGFDALPAPTGPNWWEVLDVRRDVSDQDLTHAYHRARSRHHPDKGGSVEAFDAVEQAFTAALAERGRIRRNGKAVGA